MEKEKDKKEEISKKIFAIEHKIDKENRKIKYINEIDESLLKLSKSISNCLTLLSESMKGPEIDIMFDGMHDTSSSYYKKVSKSLEEELNTSKKELSSLKKQQEELSKEYKENSKQE